MTETVSHAGADRTLLEGVGVMCDEAVTAAEAIEQGGLDWRVELRDAGYRVNGGVFKASQIGRKAIVRLDDQGDPVADLGYVGRKYNPIQNREMFEWCDHLVHGAGASYESAWSLYDGQVVGLTMRFPDHVMVGGEDPYAKYLLVRADHTGRGSMIAAVTMVRLHCTNMINVAIRNAERVHRVRHLGNTASKMQAARESLQVTLRYVDEFESEMQRLIEQTISFDEAHDTVKDLLAAQRWGGVAQKANEVMQLVTESPTIQDDLRGTKYGLLQGLAEWTDWGRPVRTSQSNAVDLLDGRVRRVKDAAMAALLLSAN